MRIGVVRRGGIAGVALSATFDTDKIIGLDTTRLRFELDALPWGRTVPPAVRPDQFYYEVTIEQDGARRSAVLSDDEVPPALRPLLERLPEVGEIPPPSG
jgi:hypothetical protein